MEATDSAAWTLVQPTGRRREWELRDDDGPLARLRIATFRSGADAEIGDRRLRIQRLGRFRGGYAVLDESTRGEIARLRRDGRQQVLDLEGVSYRWQRVGGRFGFVRDDGESLVAAKVRSGVIRSSGEVFVGAHADERQAVVAALLACYLLIRRNDQAAAAAGGTVAATTAG